jgi:hypothetical protein
MGNTGPVVPSCMEALAMAISSNAEIVICSSWREMYSLPQLRKMLGNQLGQQVVSVTPVIVEPFFIESLH